MDDVSLTLADPNHAVVDAWRAVFDGACNVTVLRASLLDQRVDAWVTPTNAHAVMSGGVDALVRGHLGPGIQARLRRMVTARWGGAMPLGAAACVSTGRLLPSYLVATPTMCGPTDDISATLHVALACAGALQAIREQNILAPSSIRSVAMPGLGTGTGRVAPAVCADLMHLAWRLFEGRTFATLQHLRAALADELGDLGDLGEHGGGNALDEVGARVIPRRPRPAVCPVPYHGRRVAV